MTNNENIRSRVLRRRFLWASLLGVIALAVFFSSSALGFQQRVTGGIGVLRERGPEAFARELREWITKKTTSRDTAVELPTAQPATSGFDAEKLTRLQTELADLDTDAFLILKDGKLIHEWYREGHRDNQSSLAALAKGVVGSLTFAAAVEAGVVNFDDSAAKYITEWRGIPKKEEITLSQLASHMSGLEEIDFGPDMELKGWRRMYVETPHERFQWSIDSTDVVFEPGTRYHYSGVGYYVLATAIARGLQASGNYNAKSLYSGKVLDPIGVPAGAWRMSYGQNVVQDDVELYAIGSGASLTPRAVAAIGQLVLNRGEMNGHRVLSEQNIDALLSPHDANARDATPDEPIVAHGWYRNLDRFWPSLPPDAIVGAGIGHQLLLIVPSERLVAVRLGGPLDRPRIWGGDFWDQLETHIFSPLMAAKID